MGERDEFMLMPSSKEAEKNLQQLLERYSLTKKLTIRMVKGWILNEQRRTIEAVHVYNKKWNRYFQRVKDIDEFNRIAQVFTDAWNAFPHSILGGKSPNKVATEAMRNNPELRKKDDQQHMPKIIVGDQEMSWDDYQAMITHMEAVQVPFRTWAEKQILPPYRRFLEKQFAKRTVEKHYYVADMFFIRVLHVGFVDCKGIRPDFIQREFPRWWQTHVLDSNMSPTEIRSSLKKLFQFISLVDDIDVKMFGF